MAYGFSQLNRFEPEASILMSFHAPTGRQQSVAGEYPANMKIKQGNRARSSS